MTDEPEMKSNATWLLQGNVSTRGHGHHD